MHIYSAIKTIADYIKWVNLKQYIAQKKADTESFAHHSMAVTQTAN